MNKILSLVILSIVLLSPTVSSDSIWLADDCESFDGWVYNESSDPEDCSSYALGGPTQGNYSLHIAFKYDYCVEAGEWISLSKQFDFTNQEQIIFDVYGHNLEGLIFGRRYYVKVLIDDVEVFNELTVGDWHYDETADVSGLTDMHTVTLKLLANVITHPYDPTSASAGIDNIRMYGLPPSPPIIILPTQVMPGFSSFPWIIILVVILGTIIYMLRSDVTTFNKVIVLFTATVMLYIVFNYVMSVVIPT